MKNLLVLSFSIWFLCSCGTYNKSEVLIEGSGMDRKISKVYLTEAGRWTVMLDSAECLDGKFNLKHHFTTPFEPFLASISYNDDNGADGSFYFRNRRQIKKRGSISSSSSFMLDFGKTKIRYFGPTENGSYANIYGGMEENLYQKYDPVEFGSITTEKNVERKRKLQELIKLIEGNPNSYYFLRSIFRYRERYSKHELIKILNLFNARLKKSKFGIRLSEHITNSLNNNENTRPLSLLSSLGIIKKDINKTAKINMLIFWASWCGPCRLEIPQLKEIRASFQSRDFYMASISIDKSKSDWTNALLQENMTWDQFIVGGDDKTKIESEYGFSAIPLIIFTNGDGKELERFSGYDENNIQRYKTLIERELKR